MVLLYIILGIVFWLAPLCWIMASTEQEYRQPTDRVLWFIVLFFLPPADGLIFMVRGFFDKASLEASSISSGLSSRTYQAQDLKRADQ